MDVIEKKIEAVLFTVGKDITSERISSLCNIEVKEVEKIMKKLQKSYSQQDNSLQILKKENGWKLTVLDKFLPLVSSIITSTELERPLMETLAVIAWKYPVVQSEIVKLRNASVSFGKQCPPKPKPPSSFGAIICEGPMFSNFPKISIIAL